MRQSFPCIQRILLVSQVLSSVFHASEHPYWQGVLVAWNLLLCMIRLAIKVCPQLVFFLTGRLQPAIFQTVIGLRERDAAKSKLAYFSQIYGVVGQEQVAIVRGTLPV